MYYIYIIRCEDNSLYTGITSDLKRRMEEHFTKDEKCAKYTKSHSAKKLEIAWQTENRQLAAKLEYHIKTLTKDKKESIIKSKSLNILSDKIEIKKYLKTTNFIN